MTVTALAQRWSRILEWIKRDAVLRVLLGVGLTVLYVALFPLGTFEWLELRLHDLRYSLIESVHRVIPNPPLKTPVLLIRIDEESEDHLNLRATDITRGQFAQAVTNLAKAGASLIAFDVIFSRPSKSPAQDKAFAGALKQAGNVVLARYIGEKGHRKPLPLFRDAELSEALINVQLEQDRCLRSMPLVAVDFSGEEPEPVLAMSFELARLFSASEGEQELDLSQAGYVGLGSLRIPNPDGRMRIRFFGPPATFPRMSFWRAVTGGRARQDRHHRSFDAGPA